MPILQLEEGNITKTVSQCAEALQHMGAVLLIPTETVYGLACIADDTQARERIYRMKSRSEKKPLALFLDSIDKLHTIDVTLSDTAARIANSFCPGPVTLLVQNKNNEKTGFRIPDHIFMLELLKSIEKPLAVTSANRSGEPNAISIQEALDSLKDDTPELIVDEGAISKDALASTVIDIEADSWKIVRQGAVTKNDITFALTQ